MKLILTAYSLFILLSFQNKCGSNSSSKKTDDNTKTELPSEAISDTIKTAYSDSINDTDVDRLKNFDYDTVKNLPNPHKRLLCHPALFSLPHDTSMQVRYSNKFRCKCLDHL